MTAPMLSSSRLSARAVIFSPVSEEVTSSISPAIALLTLRFGQRFRARDFDRAGFQFNAPLLLLHGSLDPICPIEDARDIVAAAPHARLIEIPGAGHNNLWTDPAFAGQSLAAVQRFLHTSHISPPTRV